MTRERTTQKTSAAITKTQPSYLALRPATDGLTVADAVRENVGSGGLRASDLARIRVPAGGGLAWDKPDLEQGTVSASEIQGVIVEQRDVRVYWAKAFAGGSEPPQCASDDGENGHGNPGGLCADCPLAGFGSKVIPGQKTKGRAQACRAMKLLFVLEADSLLPTCIVVPPSSLKAVRQYLVGLTSKARPYWSVETVLTLEKTKSADGIVYSRIIARPAGLLDAETTARVRGYRDALLPALTQLRAERGDVNE